MGDSGAGNVPAFPVLDVAFDAGNHGARAIFAGHDEGDGDEKIGDRRKHVQFRDSLCAGLL